MPVDTLTQTECVRLALPKGRMQDGVLRLLAEAGIDAGLTSRAYRPRLSIDGYETKLLKPQNIIEMLMSGSRDLGFAGADWVAELDADVVELLDTGLDPVKLVAAAPEALLVAGGLPAGPLVVASEYERLAKRWMCANDIDGRFVRSFGATEVFPPEDADCIVDNTASGSTLEANSLVIVDELMTSSTRLFANAAVLDDASRRRRIDDFVLLLRAVLEARQRVMIEINVDAERLDRIIEILPCMRHPTVSRLHGEAGFAVKAAVPRAAVPALVPAIKAAGGTDIIITRTTQIVP